MSPGERAYVGFYRGKPPWKWAGFTEASKLPWEAAATAARRRVPKVKAPVEKGWTVEVSWSGKTKVSLVELTIKRLSSSTVYTDSRGVRHYPYSTHKTKRQAVAAFRKRYIGLVKDADRGLKALELASKLKVSK